jgi:hypothetical protein
LPSGRLSSIRQQCREEGTEPGQDSRSISGLWRKVPEFDDDNVREVTVYSYRVMYRIQEKGVLIAAVIHGKRNVQ